MIDPVTHLKQVRAVATKEQLCPFCGRRTRNAFGSHNECRVLRSNLHLAKMTTDQLSHLASDVRVELQRRRDAIAKALEAP
jgi:sarcosine oxidase delta subunit